MVSYAFAADNATHIALAGRDGAIWKPVGLSPENGYPLIVFSHGFDGCNSQSALLMEALAHAGYIVGAPNQYLKANSPEPSKPLLEEPRPAGISYLKFKDRD